MDLRIILISCLFIISVEMVVLDKPQKCLTGYMTDVQSWVDSKGVITNNVDYHSVIDLSANSNPVPVLQQKMTIMRFTGDIYVKYLSMARCRLSRVPTVFQFRDSQGRDLAETVEYMTFYGNSFQDISSPGEEYDVSINATHARARIVGVSMLGQSNAVWSTGFQKTEFPRLKELDLRACSIQVLSGNIFTGMPNLEALYIGENEVIFVDANAFSGLNNLIHLDFSRNEAFDDAGNFKTLTTETLFILEPLKNLASLDLSFTKMTNRYAAMLESLGPKLTRLSLCEVGWTVLEDGIFNQTSLRILDVTGNSGILSRANVLRGLEDSLEVLYAKDTRLRSTDLFLGFRRLEVLGIAMNEINIFSSEVAKSLISLKILDLDKNRLSSWSGEIFSHMPKLELLTLKDNNVNVISEEMITDMAEVKFVAVSGNFIVCNCHSRDFFDLAWRNEQVYVTEASRWTEMAKGSPLKTYHRAYIEFNNLVKYREHVFLNCTVEEPCNEDLQDEVKGNFLLLDFHPSTYMCLQVPEGQSIQFSEVVGCNRSSRDIDYDKVIAEGRNKLYILLTIPSLLVILAVGFVFRRNFRYFFITMRNSALLSVINKNEVLDEGAIFHYDVFVSYCNEDRHWVLDHLLPHLETDCSISACLHERDFQVGHSILENIVSCMDRSRSIMLIISQRFLLSQWCQFEMHLAQHRLLETRREDLTLVLLEEIPRRLRPNTLHYLMLTKTYIVWPEAEAERGLFWRRVKKSLINMKMKQATSEGVSLA